MEYIQTKPNYNQGYYHNPNGANYIMQERGGTYCIVDNNTYSNNHYSEDPNIQLMLTNNNMRKSCSNTYNSKQQQHIAPPPLDFDDILDADDSLCLDEETIIVPPSDEKPDDNNDRLGFDLEEEHILPPCFDTLINADNQMLASPDLSILKLDLNNPTPSPEDTNSDILNNNYDLTLDHCREIEDDTISPTTPTTRECRRNDSTSTNSCSRNETIRDLSDETSSSMSEKEIQLIKEVNKSLDCILPVKKEENEEDNIVLEGNDLNFDHIFEPLQQVPCLEDINLSSRPPPQHHHVSPPSPPQCSKTSYNQNIHHQTNERNLSYYQDDLPNNYNTNLCNSYGNNNLACSSTNYDNSYCTNYNGSDICSEMNSRDLSNEYMSRELSNEYVNRELCNEYSNNHRDFQCGNEYAKSYYIKNESPPSMIHNGAFYVKSEDSSASFYDMIEEQVRHQNKKRDNEAKISRKILDRYLPAEQDLIKRYIEGDKCHLPIPPVNMEIQEIIRRERKKHKNRVAASKCRKKKLEREAQLEVRVNYLKERSVELNNVMRELRNQATTLKQRIMEHINAGCTLNPNILSGGISPYYR